VGDSVIAIGSPLNLDGSVTAGIVSALNRNIVLDDLVFDEDEVTPVASAIQTDAAINPGNSGGALINLDGEVVGINTAIARPPGITDPQSIPGNIGIGFAIPIEDAQRVANQLIDDGEVAIAFLGVNILDADEGALIDAVSDDSPADEAGLETDDIVIQVDDERVDGATALTAVVRRHSPGDEVTITFLRDGEERSVDVTLGTLDQAS
jgi:putative serine protease PepD